MAYGKISKKQLEILEYIKSEILRIGYPPAATWPTIGTFTISRLVRLNVSSIISIARGFVGSRLIYPFFSKVSRWEWTDDVDFKFTASQISRTAGG